MVKMSNGSVEINWEKKGSHMLVTLAPNQFNLTQVKVGEALFAKHGFLLPGEIQELEEEKVVIAYDVPTTAIPLSLLDNNYDEVERLEIAQKLMILTDWKESIVIPFIHPDNLFLLSGNLVLAHRGIIDTVEPNQMTEELFLQQYKAITIYIIHSKYNYDQLVAGSTALKDAFSQQVSKATTVEEVQDIVNQQYKVMLEKRQQSQKLVNKYRYQFFKWGAIILFLVTIGFSVSTFVFGLKQVPLKNRIIASEAAFISRDFDKTVKELEGDNPKKIPTSAQYVLAASYVRLNDLTNEQKEAILSTLSQKSTTNELLFWVFLGKGELNEALSIAKNIGDDQLILHTYTKLYDATKANTTMSGEKKQKQLEEYQKEIENYTKKIDGEKNDGSKK